MKVVLITGASSGIGFDTAKTLAIQGYKVYAVARRVELMEPLKEYAVIPLKMDITNEISIQNVLKYIIDIEKKIDILINNAGYGYFGAIENVSIEEARKQLETNLFGLARLSQLVIPTMRENGVGRIINISSMAGKSVFLYGGWYHVSKYSVEALSDAMRIELKPFGIDVVLVEPGGIKTNWGSIAANYLEESSKGTVYAESSTIMANLFRKGYNSNILSDPKIVTKAICSAVKSRRPKTRYKVGLGSNLIVILHSILPTRCWDALMRCMGRIKIDN